ncbi:MAG TPA: hypothetical protein VGJ20_41440 [Xanthobacteraceae bacterium]
MFAVAMTLSLSFAGASFAAKAVKLPLGGCAVSKKAALNNGGICSFDCKPTTMWCSRQMCNNGQLTKIINCYGNFRRAKCG